MRSHPTIRSAKGIQKRIQHQNHVFTNKRLIENTLKQDKELYLASVDLE